MRNNSILPLVALALAACATDTTQPGATVAASYIAAVPAAGSNSSARGALVVTVNSGSVMNDVPVGGAQLQLVLDAGGSTSGHMFIPASTTTAAVDADLAGSWSMANGIVTLRQNADTFLRDMPLTLQGTDLVGDRTFGDTRVRLTLVRQDAQ